MDEGVRPLTNGVKLIGETILPGTSLLMDGKFGEGAAHAVVGIGARILLGPIGALVVAADSFSKSVADKNLWNYAPKPVTDAIDRVGDALENKPATPTATPTATADPAKAAKPATA